VHLISLICVKRAGMTNARDQFASARLPRPALHHLEQMNIPKPFLIWLNTGRRSQG
jgi:hypothetical protein